MIRRGGLYIHLPFCSSLCHYCHFVRSALHDHQLRREVVAAIGQEFRLRRERCQVLRQGRRALETVYVGGGTPSLLELGLFQQLLTETAGQLSRTDPGEVTAEANPESFTPELADGWRQAGVNRVSLGVQSLDDTVLHRLGRNCSARVARQAVALACRTFSRVSIDLILGPGCRREPLLAGLRELVAAGVGHVSLYILELFPGTELARQVEAGQVQMPRSSTLEVSYLAAVALLAELGLPQYEVANFARPGEESNHNRHYWSRLPYLGLGPGAHGFWGRRRYANCSEIGEYLRRITVGELPESEVDPLSPTARRLEQLILPLRTRDGVPLAILPAGALLLAKGEAAGLWVCADGRLTLTPRGYLQIDSIEIMLARALASA
ncbi:MAG: coproporphyrinogen-III oxidase family protein [bacterium]